MPVIDIHTHMITEAWVDMLRKYGAPDYSVQQGPGGIDTIVERGIPTMTLIPEMHDCDRRIRDMDRTGIDLSIISLTSPSVYWGNADTSTETARIINDGMQAIQGTYPDRVRYMATLPWQYPTAAVKELARVCDRGAVGVTVLANIHGIHLTDPSFFPIWEEIDRRGLPVFIHPTTPPGYHEMDLGTHKLLGAVGFTFDTTLAISRLVMDGFLDRYPNVKIITSHGGGTLPYISSRMDLFFRHKPPQPKKISAPPSSYFRRIYFDAILYDKSSLQHLINIAGVDRVMFGTDYPHPADIEDLLDLIRDLPSDASQAILGKNAQQLFAL